LIALRVAARKEKTVAPSVPWDRVLVGVGGDGFFKYLLSAFVEFDIEGVFLVDQVERGGG
jgi:hypothetical protein